MLRVQTVKLVGPGLDSMSPERRIKAKIRGLRQYWIREREKIRCGAIIVLMVLLWSCVALFMTT